MISMVSERMPIMFTDMDQAKNWLTESHYPTALESLQPISNNKINYYRISEKIFHKGYDQADLHERVEYVPTLFDI